MNNQQVYLVTIADTQFVEMNHEEWLDYNEHENYFYETMLEDNEDIVKELDCGRVYYCQRTGAFRAVSWHTGQDVVFDNKHDAVEWLIRQ